MCWARAPVAPISFTAPSDNLGRETAARPAVWKQVAIVARQGVRRIEQVVFLDIPGLHVEGIADAGFVEEFDRDLVEGVKPPVGMAVGGDRFAGNPLQDVLALENLERPIP